MNIEILIYGILSIIMLIVLILLAIFINKNLNIIQNFINIK